MSPREKMGLPAAGDRTVWWSFVKWAGKVVATAALGGVTASFAVYQTWTTMRADVEAHGAMLKRHDADIQALKDADIDQALSDAVAAATATAEQKSTEAQLKAIREDLIYIQRELIGRIRR